MEEKKLKLTFCGGTGTVTGANFLLEGEGKKFLIDCGLTQSEKLADDMNWKPFLYDAASIDALFITHAHIDHIGRIPKLIHDGFKGKIYSTIPTRDLVPIMLEDTATILSRDTDNHLDEIYTVDNVAKAMSLWNGLGYHEKIEFPGGFTMSFANAGHILGSGMLEVLYNGKKIVFTGDLGNSPSPILPDTEKITDADYLIMESVYGDRNHEDRDERKDMLAQVINDNFKTKGTLIIPTFSLERTQELLFEIDNLSSQKKIAVQPIFLDSPLAIRLDAVFKKHEDYFNETARAILRKGNDMFDFPGLKVTLETEQSKMILNTPDPKIIIAGSGMSNGGRIVHHEKNYLPNANNTILLVGYQSLGTLGRFIEDGNKTVKINGDEIPVRAKVAKIAGYSGHKDSDGLLAFAGDTAKTVKNIYVVMGEPKSALFLVQKIRDNFNLNASAPLAGDSVTLDCSFN